LIFIAFFLFSPPPVPPVRFFFFDSFFLLFMSYAFCPHPFCPSSRRHFGFFDLSPLSTLVGSLILSGTIFRTCGPRFPPLFFWILLVFHTLQNDTPHPPLLLHVSVRFFQFRCPRIFCPVPFCLVLFGCFFFPCFQTGPLFRPFYCLW